MAQDHHLQQQRFELKYLVEEEVTRGIRDFVSAFLELDDFAVGQPNFSYTIHSLYLDTPAMNIYHTSVNGDKNRFKLRLRYYDGDEDSPIFFEIKRRHDNCILKSRCGVRRHAVPKLLAGQWPSAEDLLSRETRHLDTLERFNLYMTKLGAIPKLYNRYKREAWVSPHDNSIRVTFDRNIHVQSHFTSDLPSKISYPHRLFPGLVVLELKFTTRFPFWFNDLVQKFNLMQTSSAKYCLGVLELGQHRFHPDSEVNSYERMAFAR